MARIKQGFLGNASGKLGNIVFSKWRDLQTARQYQPDIADAKSPAQIKQRSRMMALLQFLKPLNKNFIKFYNSKDCKGSTPWAKAIKDNMRAVSEDGCIIPQNVSFGSPKFQKPEILDALYDPFIDRLTIKFKKSEFTGKNEKFPNFFTSVLGRYKSADDSINFDTRHLLKTCINLQFECYSWDGQCEHTWANYYSDGWLWFVYVDSDCMGSIASSNWVPSEPSYFKPRLLVEDFNTDVIRDLVPTESISWSFDKKEENWFMSASIDLEKTKLTDSQDYIIRIWALVFAEGETMISESLDLDLSQTTQTFEIGDKDLSGSGIILYTIINNEGEQVSCFNRIYINSGTDNVIHDYHEQLFDYNYASPLTFVLDDNKTAFCGSIDELFGEFIELYNQGLIFDHSDNPVEETRTLRVSIDGDGTVDVDGQIGRGDNVYYFKQDQIAYLTLMPSEGYEHKEWSGDDAGFLEQVSENTYSIPMIKNRSLLVSFTAKSK